MRLMEKGRRADQGRGAEMIVVATSSANQCLYLRDSARRHSLRIRGEE